MTVLITGATGLVGQRLVPRLIASGHTCRVLQRRGKDGPPGAERVEGDLFEPLTLEAALSGVTAVIHLAAMFRTPDADLIWKTNHQGSVGLLAATRRHAPGARFILASTSHVYDPGAPHAGRETDPVFPQHPYPASKAAAEQALVESGLNWVVLRFPFIYGDGDGHLEALPEHVGSWHPAQRMSTIHHRDIASAMRMALAGAFDGRIINLADEAQTSVSELLRLVGAEMPGSAEPLAQPWKLLVDVSVARSLGFQPDIRTVHQAVQAGLL